MIVDEDEYLAHYGTPRKSGRYPWGSGKSLDPRNHRSFLDTVDELKKTHGMSEPQIAESFGMTTTRLRALRSIAVNQQKQEQINQAQRLKDRGWSNTKIGERMNLNESTVRSLLADGRKDKADILQATAEMLKRQVADKEFVDVGEGVELDVPVSGNAAAPLRLSKDRFQTAVAVLREEGYEVHTLKIPQQGTGKLTTYKVLCKPGTSQRDAWMNRDKIQQISEHTEDGGRPGSWVPTRPPTNISSKRVGIVYDEDGGSKRDGLIELRPGAKDLDLGGARYAQVRIAVDESHYLKGMAVYNPDLPAGVDVRFHTNKKDTGNKLDAMKEMEQNPDGTVNLKQPFTASIKSGGQRGALNIINEEGDWEKHSRNLPAQMLSKQPVSLARQQLARTYEDRRRELEKISKLNNPAIKKKLLQTFGDETDAAAVHLKAAAMPKQASKVLLPIPEVRETEIYAPSFTNGTRVALVRFPHGGTFEIPQLTVNNRNPVAKKLLGTNAADAVGINHKVAERLSGADFDGDHVLVIPNNLGLVKSKPPLEGLKGFDPKRAHPPYDGMPTIDGGKYNAATKKVEYGPKGPTTRMQLEMGMITNLIADMTIRGANDSEIARAVRHSMVVIDAEKHHLDFKGSKEANGIPALKKRYQGRSDAGATTLITRAGSTKFIDERKARPAAEGGAIDPTTGKKVFVKSERMVKDKNGNLVPKQERVDWLSIEDDARTLSSGTVIENVYADHSNRLKALANESRKEYLNTKPTPYSPSAKKTYANEVGSLNAKLNRALKNAPRERQAQVVAETIVRQRKQANPGMDKDDLKKVRNQALAEARVRTGAGKDRITIEPEEWRAIQAGAISNARLEKILNNSNLEEVKKLATPKEVTLMTSSNKARAEGMLARGFTQAEVAAQLGVSLTTLKTGLSE